MEELIKLVSQKTGLPQAQAKVAVEVVFAHLKRKLPAPVMDQVNQALSGAGAAEVTKRLGGLMGGKK